MSGFRMTLVLPVAIVVGACFGARVDGPISRTDTVEINIPARDSPVAWGMPISPTSGPVILRRIELIEVSGLDILGIGACVGSSRIGDDYLNCAPTTDAWPPASVAVREVDGTVIESSPDQNGGLLIGAQLQDGAANGSASGVRIFYSYAGADYQVEQPWSLQLGQ